MAKLLHTEKDETLRASSGPAKNDGDGVDSETITITEAAAKAIERQRAKRGTPEAAIRVGLRGGGCGGFSYHFDWAEGEPKDTDHVFEAFGAVIYVDEKSFAYLKGMVLDYQTGMMGHGFQFNNPNAKGTCGCGESVQF